jgi:murein DD-endopeptidase MepM/ murein hydrolase activator NlpD
MTLDYKRPCKTRVIRDDFDAHVKRHSNLPGVDYACKTGDEVFATADGVVIAVSYLANTPSGKMITIRHRDGKKSYYLHLSRIRVAQGNRVRQGALIALSGDTGTTSTGPHLHFSIRNKDGKCVDPEKVLARDPQPRDESKPAGPKPKGPAVKTPRLEVMPEAVPE